MSYAFGDDARAAKRLALLARVFEPASRGFLADHAAPGGALALDLGCGPGFTTELVAEVGGCARTLGLDASEAYVTVARARAPEGCEFLAHDVLDTPYPCGPADRVYGRFLVSHLADRAGALAGFVSQLAPGGRLLLDEVEWIRSEAPVFECYLAAVERVLEARGQCLFVGPSLASLARDVGRPRSSEVRELAVDPRDAARMFALNWETLRESPALTEAMTDAERAELAETLAALARGRDAPDAAITWGLRQLAIEA